MLLAGVVKVDKKTKNLVKRIKPHEIAVIDHADLDEVAALSLVRARVKAVINAQSSITGKYPNTGPLIIIQHHIPLIDEVGPQVLSLKDRQKIVIKDDKIYCDNKLLATGVRETKESVIKAMELSKANMYLNVEKFVNNTLFYAEIERDLILGNLEIPDLKVKFDGRHTLIVIRGKSYQEDLRAVHSYIGEVKPVLIGVDGGADALIECGYRPDIILGDMDSISDEALTCGTEILVHAYPNGHAPGLERIKRLGLESKVFPAPGTSEDAAMLLAYHGNTELIVAVGTHTNVIDFLEKGRKGMASTLLTRIKVGSILIDAKGVSKLYGRSMGISPILQVVIAAFFPFLMLVSASTLLSQLGRLVLLKFKVLLNI